MKELLIQIVKALVDNPEQIQVNEIVSVQTVVLELKVAKNDMGKIIGKQGLIKCSFRKNSEKVRARDC